MRTISTTITALILGVSSLAVGSVAQAHGYSGKSAYRDHVHHQHYYHAPRYPSRPRVRGHDHYQYNDHGIHKKHRRHRYFGKVYDWRSRPHRFNDYRSDHGRYRGNEHGDHQRLGHDDRNRHRRDHSRRMNTAYVESDRH